MKSEINKRFIKLTFGFLFAAGFLLLFTLIGDQKAYAYSAVSRIDVDNIANSPIKDDGFEIIFTLSANNTVIAGDDLTVHATGRCNGDDSSGSRTMTGRIINSGNPFTQFNTDTYLCPPDNQGTLGSRAIPIPYDTTPGTYYLDFRAVYVGPEIDTSELVMRAATQGLLQYDVVEGPGTQPPSASLRVKKDTDIIWGESVTVAVGETINYDWSSERGSSYRSTYEVTDGGSGCLGYLEGPWIANNSSDFSETDADPDQAGCTYRITYFVEDSEGIEVSDDITVTITSGPVGPACTGNIPNGGEEWDPEEQTGLSVDLPWAYASSDTSRKCEFRCASGTWNPATQMCEGAPPPPPPPGPEWSLLEVDKIGSGDGWVTSSGGEIDCGLGCTSDSAWYPLASCGPVSLSGVSGPGSNGPFFSDDCGPGSSCTVNMCSDKHVNVSFGLVTHQLEVFKAGTGSGVVTGPGINCGSNCLESYTPGTEVTLTATEDPGSTFDLWEGCDSVNGSECTVTMDTYRDVTATFGGSGSFADLIPRSWGCTQCASTQGGVFSPRARAQNVGSISAGNFITRMSYKWGNHPTPWEPGSEGEIYLGGEWMTDSPYNPGDYSTYHQEFMTLDNNGPLSIMYCVDSSDDVYEGPAGEANNCDVWVRNINPGSNPAVTLTATPSTIEDGDTTDLIWTVSNATTCSSTSEHGDWDVDPVSNTGGTNIDFTPGVTAPDTAWYRVDCSNSFGHAWSIASVDVTTPLQPDLVTQNFSTSPSSVEVGENISVTGNTYNQGDGGTGSGFDDHLQVNFNRGGWTSWQNVTRSALNAGESTSALQGDYTPASAGIYVFRHCADFDGSQYGQINESDEGNNCTQSGQINVTDTSVSCGPSEFEINGQCVSGSITADPEEVIPGDTSEIGWTLTGASGLNCSVTGNWIDYWDTDLFSSPQPSSPITASTTYTLGCETTPMYFVDVDVVGSPTLTADPRVVEEGDSTDLIYNTGGQACTLSGGNLGSLPVNETTDTFQDSGVLEATTTFTLECPTDTITVTVEVIPKGFET